MGAQNTILLPNQLSFNGADRGLTNLILNGASFDDIRINNFRTNATLLQKDEWKEIDDAVLGIVRTRLDAVQDLIDLNLIKRLGGLGTLISEYERSSDMTDAEISMSPLARSEFDTMKFDITGVPVPVVQKDFQLDIRRLSASRKRGDSLDTIQAEVATRKVAEASENMLINGKALYVGGYKIYGYTNHPNRITGTSNDWGTIANIYTAISNMIAAAAAKGFNGPFYLYIASTQYEQARAVYTDGSGDSALERIRDKFPEIKKIKKLFGLDAGELVLVQMTRDVVDLAVAERIQTVEWSTHGGFLANFKVMAVWVPRVKADQDGNCGVVHYTGA